MPDIPTNNTELYLANIAGESEQMPDFPTNKIERYLAKIAENGGGGGGGGEGPEPYTSSPAMDGTAAAGSSDKYARGDHVHPTDTSRAAQTTEVTNTATAPDEDGPVYRCTIDNNVWSPADYPQGWEVVE